MFLFDIKNSAAGHLRELLNVPLNQYHVIKELNQVTYLHNHQVVGDMNSLCFLKVTIIRYDW